MRLLVVEDYEAVRKSIAKGLRELGAEVSVASDGQGGLDHLRSSSFDVVILDLMLPGVDGLTVLKQAREAGDDTMVLILTARNRVQDRVDGLDAGADDYLAKPFAFEELVARVRALYRRKHQIRTPVVTAGRLMLDLNSGTVQFDDQPVPLSPREYSLLECLALRKNRIVPREAIWMALYDLEDEPSSNVVDVYVGYLRKKLAAFEADSLIQTRRGQGYILVDPPA